MDRRIAFCHVPKAAGSSVRAAVANEVGADRVAPFQLDRTVMGSFDDFEQVRPDIAAIVLRDSPDALGPYQAALGHFSVTTLLGAFDAADIFCLLREPRSRLVSHFSFWASWDDAQHEAWEPYRASRAPAELGWEGFCAQRSIATQVDNLTLRMILAPHPLIPEDDFIDPADLETLAEHAIERVEQLGHVDVIDAGDGFWDRLSAWLGHPVVPQRDNVTHRPTSGTPWGDWLTPSAMALLTARTRGDRMIWDHIARRVTNETDALADSVFISHIARASAPAPASEPAGTAAPIAAPSIAEPAVGEPRSPRWLVRLKALRR